MAKKKRPAARQTIQKKSQLSGRFLEQLATAEMAYNAGNWDQAYTILLSLEKIYSRSEEVLEMLVDVTRQLGQVGPYLNYAERLHKLRPNNPIVVAALANAYMLNMFPMHAHGFYSQFSQRWPDHEHYAEVQKSLTLLNQLMSELYEELGVRGEPAHKLALMHEQMQRHMAVMNWKGVIAAGQQALQIQDDIIPILNNLSLAYFYGSQPEEALATIARVLELDSHNLHALSNRIGFLVMSGRYDEAWAFSSDLKLVQPPIFDHAVKQIEALSYLGDDMGVLASFEKAKALEDKRFASVGRAQAYHLAAVAYLRLDNEKEARQHWKVALQMMPQFQVAQDNLADLDQPAALRHAPWPFPFRQWVRPDLMHGLQQITERQKPQKQRPVTSKERSEFGRFFQSRPELIRLAPQLLDRGDAIAREFALFLANVVNDPDLNEAVRDYALSNRGPDNSRLEAARIAQEAGVLPQGSGRMFMQGKWHDQMLLLNFEISNEPVQGDLPHRAFILQRDATIAMHKGQYSEAERKLLEAIQLAPNSPGILNNLASSYEAQGRSKDAMAIIERVFNEFPDYIFGQLNMANIYIIDGKLDDADKLIQPIMQRTQFHTSEFTALATAQANLCMARRQFEGAEQWIDFIERVNPDELQLARLRQDLALRRLPHPISRLLGRGRQ